MTAQLGRGVPPVCGGRPRWEQGPATLPRSRLHGDAGADEEIRMVS